MIEAIPQIALLIAWSLVAGLLLYLCGMTLLRYARATFLIVTWLIFDGRAIGLHRTRREFLRAVWESETGRCA